MYKRPLRTAILALLGSAAASNVVALGFGSVPDSTVFGQALDLRVPLHLDPASGALPGCLKAEVLLGDQRLPEAMLRLSIEPDDRSNGANRLRLRSSAVVLEPLVSVQLSVGCHASVTRQFVLFADPPGLRAEAAAPSAVEPVQPPVASPAPAAAPSGSAAAVATAAGPAARSSMSPTSAKASKTSRSTRKSDRSARQTAVAAKAPKTRLPVATAKPPAAERAAPRLKLEEPDKLLRAATLAVAAQDEMLASAEQAASAAQAAASAAEAQLAKLTDEVTAMRADAEANRATLAQMRTRVAQAEDQSRLTWVLALVAALLSALTLWLGLRLRALQRERQAGWWQVAQAAAPQPRDAVEASTVADAVPAPLGEPLAPTVGEAGAPLVPEPASAETETAVASMDGALGPLSLTRAVSVDELIDLEQQAEFFVVLGEADSAADLLMAHLRGSGGVSPLPYLKLLEIYRRGGDRDAYERIRKRFDHRFNTVAPDWGDDLERGRDLQAYANVVATLQAVWPEPLDAMAELENLLFRKRSGELFELPAYRDVLTLYAVARDLHRRVDDETADVDVLLPLGSGLNAEATARQSVFDYLSSEAIDGAVLVEDRPTAPIDLDLSNFDSASDRAARPR